MSKLNKALLGITALLTLNGAIKAKQKQIQAKYYKKIQQLSNRPIIFLEMLKA